MKLNKKGEKMHIESLKNNEFVSYVDLLKRKTIKIAVICL